jgi:hypothetical protein
VAHKLALQNPHLRVDVIEASEFPALAQRYGIRAVPTTVIDDKVVVPGAMDETALLQTVLNVVSGRPLSVGPPAGASVSALPASRGSAPPSPGGLILP